MHHSDALEHERQRRQRHARLRDVSGTAGMLSVVAGVGLMSVPWAFVVLGSLLLCLSTIGTILHARSLARTPRR